jgi:hypothetical protein
MRSERATKSVPDEMPTFAAEMARQRAEAIRECRDYANRLLLWVVPSTFAGITGLGVAAGLLS